MEQVRHLLVTAQAAGAFPAATIEVGRRNGPVYQEAIGRLTEAPDAEPCRLDTIFDLASLTKVIATASIAMRLVDAGRLDLDAPIGRIVGGWPDAVAALVTARHLLDHSSGFAAHAPLWRSSTTRDQFVAALRRLSPERPPGQVSVYSDVGFLLLGLVLEAAGDDTLDGMFRPFANRDGDVLDYRPAASLAARTAPTEYSERLGRHLRGDVHDENAAVLGGVAAHAGLFGTATAVGAFARLVLTTFDEPTPLGPPDLMRAFARPSAVAGSSRALAWDTMRPTSSCGTRLSATAIGHTGFTGTSLWIDWEDDLYVVLLTNRVYGGRADERLVALRPRLHDAVAEALASTDR